MSKITTQGLIAVLALGSLRGVSAQTLLPKTASAAAESYLNAIRDSNLTRMADLFGNSKGPVSKSKPDGYQQKLVIQQLMLGHIQSKALAEVATGKSGEKTVTTEIAKGTCKVTITMTAVQYKDGWLIHDFPLEEASVVNKPCSKPPTGNSGG